MRMAGSRTAEIDMAAKQAGAELALSSCDFIRSLIRVPARPEERREYGQRTPMRTVALCVVSVLAYFVQVVGAHASMMCKRIEQLPPVSDIQAARAMDAYLKPLGGPDLLVKEFTGRFFFALPDKQDCKASLCYYRLLDYKDGTVRERLSFPGTGAMLIFVSPADVRIEPLDDRFATIALETSAGTHLLVGLPRTGNTVLVEARPQEPFRLPTC
jgi:hypothetical protein